LHEVPVAQEDEIVQVPAALSLGLQVAVSRLVGTVAPEPVQHAELPAAVVELTAVPEDIVPDPAPVVRTVVVGAGVLVLADVF
jgi:hypothetical protein